jgi:acid phosphatase (class A)
MLKRTAALLAVLLMAATLRADSGSAVAIQPYATTGVNMSLLLAPPPAQDSQQTKDEIAEDLKYQAARTPDQEQEIEADQKYSIFRFADVMGPNFSEDKLPLTAALFDGVIATSKGVAEVTKDTWDRSRPPAVDSRIHPCVKIPKSSSYPSGHATAGTLMAIVLANMVPEKKAEIFARGWLFALHRLMGGAHYRSDIEAGRISGTVIASAMFQDPRFQADFAAAKAELRKALGLP